MSTVLARRVPSHGLPAVLVQRRLLPFWLGQWGSYLGEAAFTTAVLWAAYRLTGSALWLAAAALAGQLPVVAVGLAGPERLPGPRLVHLPLARAAVAAGAAGAVLFVHGHASLAAAAVVAAAALQSFLEARQVPQLQASLAQAVAREHLPAANAGMEFASRLGLLTGPALAGLLLASPGAPAALAAAAGALALAYVPVVRWLAHAAPPPGTGRLAAAGFARAWPWIRRDPFLSTALAVRGLTNLVWPALSLGLPILAAGRWHAGASGYGFLMAFWGLGSLAGTALSARLSLGRMRPALLAAWVITGGVFLGLGITPVYGLALLLVTLGGAAGPTVHVALDSHIGHRVPREDMGAVFAVQRLVMSGLGAVGSMAVGGAVTPLGAGPVLMVAGAVTAAAAAFGLGFLVRDG